MKRYDESREGIAGMDHVEGRVTEGLVEVTQARRALVRTAGIGWAELGIAGEG
jgi:hypothetical protein